MKKLPYVIALALAALILFLYVQRHRQRDASSQGSVPIWGDHTVDWAFNQPRFADQLTGGSIGAQTHALTTLTGRLVRSDSKSVAAIILILGAERKSNVVYSVSTRYPRLPRHTQTDSQGNFKFESLDAAWAYDIRIIAPDCQQQVLSFVDPTAGPLNVQLEPIKSTNPMPDLVMRGRVLDPHRNPVPGALVRILGTTRKGARTWPAYDIEPFSVSDGAGNFVVYGQTAFTEAEGAVEASGFATTLFERWASGDIVHELTLTDGATLQGRVLQAGNPVANAEVRINRFGRESSSSVWDYSALTDGQGRFVFAHLPPNRGCSLYGTMESLGDRGALPKRRAQLQDDGSISDVGDLNLEPAYKVDGQIRLRDGQTIPAHAQVILSRADVVTLDSVSVAVGKDGLFHFAGVPAERVTLYLRIPGYQLTGRDRYLKAGSATNLNVVSNISGLVIEMQPASRK